MPYLLWHQLMHSFHCKSLSSAPKLFIRINIDICIQMIYSFQWLNTKYSEISDVLLDLSFHWINPFLSSVSGDLTYNQSLSPIVGNWVEAGVHCNRIRPLPVVPVEHRTGIRVIASQLNLSVDWVEYSSARALQFRNRADPMPALNIRLIICNMWPSLAVIGVVCLCFGLKLCL